MCIFMGKERGDRRLHEGGGGKAEAASEVEATPRAKEHEEERGLGPRRSGGAPARAGVRADGWGWNRDREQRKKSEPRPRAKEEASPRLAQEGSSTCRAMADAIRHNATLQEFVSHAIGTSIELQSHGRRSKGARSAAGRREKIISLKSRRHQRRPKHHASEGNPAPGRS